jgi:hypothetical protein
VVRVYWLCIKKVPGLIPSVGTNLNNIGKVYSLEYSDTPEVFFTPHHVGCCYTDVMRGFVSSSVILALMPFQIMHVESAYPRRNNSTPVIQVEYPIGKITPGHAG